MAKFQKKPFVVEAVRITDSTVVHLEDRGDIEVGIGDWVIYDEGKPKIIVSDLIFRTLYDPMDDEGRKMMEDSA